jgi:GH15 family glucan-1,4-alpha-glucosidase
MKPDTPGDLPRPIEEYAIIGDCRTGALVARTGSVDWLCWPRFDAGACFAALLGTSRHGRWLIAATDASARVSRRYRGDTLVLETLFETTSGAVAIIDFMPVGGEHSSLVRIVEGRRGRVNLRMELIIRFDYGAATPWVTQLEGGGGLSAVAGSNRAVLHTAVELVGRDQATLAEFQVAEGQRASFALTWVSSNRPVPAPLDTSEALASTEAYWQEWSGRCQYTGAHRGPVLRSLLTLKALTYSETGGIVAALTTSVPEQLGGSRNWDYRYCWLRDATLTLIALMEGGYYEEAKAWHEWLQRSVAGSAAELQIMYGLAGERLLVEWSPAWLPGNQGASPVRIGNAAAGQLQLDVYGEVVSALHHARSKELKAPQSSWPVGRELIEHLESIWRDADDGIWEMRGGRRQFTHSKVMAWVAMDRVIRDVERFGLAAPIDRWRDVRARIHAEVCAHGFSAARNSFTQSYGSPELDASLLLIPQTGFLPIDDPRITGTIAAIERELVVDGFVLRYRTESARDGLPPGEGAFLPCSFWLVDAYALQGRTAEAQALFERLVGLSNDVGLLSEEYDTAAHRLVGNFPQAFSHLALIGSALNLHGIGPAQQQPAQPS